MIVFGAQVYHRQQKYPFRIFKITNHQFKITDSRCNKYEFKYRILLILKTEKEGVKPKASFTDWYTQTLSVVCQQTFVIANQCSDKSGSF